MYTVIPSLSLLRLRVSGCPLHVACQSRMCLAACELVDPGLHWVCSGSLAHLTASHGPHAPWLCCLLAPPLPPHKRFPVTSTEPVSLSHCLLVVNHSTSSFIIKTSIVDQPLSVSLLIGSKHGNCSNVGQTKVCHSGLPIQNTEHANYRFYGWLKKFQ